MGECVRVCNSHAHKGLCDTITTITTIMTPETCFIHILPLCGCVVLWSCLVLCFVVLLLCCMVLYGLVLCMCMGVLVLYRRIDLMYRRM